MGLLVGGAASAQARTAGRLPLARRAPASPAPPPRIRALAGCYRLRAVGVWQSGRTPTMPTWGFPDVFRLDTAPLVRYGPTRFAVAPTGSARWPASWGLAGDSVNVVWSSGFVGTSFTFVARGDTLVGRAQEFHDAHTLGEPPDPAAEVRAIRIECSRTRLRPN